MFTDRQTDACQNMTPADLWQCEEATHRDYDRKWLAVISDGRRRGRRPAAAHRDADDVMHVS